MVDLDALEALADAAPSGPWARGVMPDWEDDRIVQPHVLVDYGDDAASCIVPSPLFEANGNLSIDLDPVLDFIAAANPETVKELIARLRRAEDLLAVVARHRSTPYIEDLTAPYRRLTDLGAAQ